MDDGPGLPPVDRLELTTLVDNTIDALLRSTTTVRRAPRNTVLGGPRSRLRAEHGFSTLVTEQDGRRHSLLFDAGLTPDVLVHNMHVLEVQPGNLQAIVLSHGHADHALGLLGMCGTAAERHSPW